MAAEWPCLLGSSGFQRRWDSKQSRNHSISAHWALEVTLHHFCRILLFKAVISTSILKDRGQDPTSRWICRCILKLLQSSLWPQTLTCFLREKYTPSQGPPLWHQAQVRRRLLIQDVIIIKSCPYQLFAIGNSLITLNLGSVSSAECQELICKLKWEFYFGWEKNGRLKEALKGMLQFSSNNISNVTNNKTQGAKVSQGPCHKWGT